MGRDISIGIGIDGEREFKQAVSDITRESRLLTTELTAINAQYQDNAGSIEHLTAQQNVYQRQQTQLRENIELYNRALQNATATYGENSSQVDNWRLRILQAQTALANCEHNIRDTSTAINQLQTATQNSENGLRDINNAADSAASGLRNVDNAAGNTASSLENTNQQGLTVANLFKSQLFANLAADAIRKLASELGDFIKKGIELASDLQEVQNVVDVTFKDSAHEIYNWAEAAAESYGLSALSAEKFNGTMGAMLKSMGLTDSEIVNMSTSLVGLSGDMASFYNLDVQTAFDKIRAGISGETEPLKQLGVNMSVVNLETFAMSQGIDKAWKSMTQAEQTTIRYQYILQATADAQGDFARTSDSFANQQRILELNLENVSATVGTALLPALNSLLQKLNDEFDSEAVKRDIEDIAQILQTLVGVLIDVTKFMIDHKEVVLGVAVAWGGLSVITNILPVISNATIAFQGLSTAMGGISFATVTAELGALLGPLGLLALAIGGVVAVVDLCTTSEAELAEKAEKATDAFEKQTEILASCKTELENYNNRQQELIKLKQEQGFLSEADQNELNNLNQKIELKELELELEEEDLAAKQKESDLANIATMQNTARADSLANLKQQMQDYQDGLVAIDETYAAMQQAQKDGNTDVAEAYQNDLIIMQEAQDNLTQNIKYTTLAVNEFSSDISDTTEEGSAYHKELQNVNGELSSMLNLSIGLENLSPTEGAVSAAMSAGARILSIKEKIQSETEKLNSLALTSYENSLQTQMDDLEHSFKIKKLTEEEYYIEQQKVLDGFTNKNSELYWKYQDNVTGYYDKIADTAAKSAEKQQKANETAAKNAEKDAKEAFDKLLKEYNKGTIDRQTFNSKYKALLDSWGSNYQNTVQYVQESITELEEKEQDKRQKTLQTKVDEAISTYEKQIKDIEGKINGFKSKNGKSFEDFFDVSHNDVTNKDTADFGKGKDASMAIDQESDVLKAYDKKMQELRSKGGISDEIVDQIAAMSIQEGTALANTLMKYSKDELQEMSDSWAKYQAKLDETAKAPYGQQLSEAETELKENLATLATSALAELQASTGGAVEVGRQMVLQVCQGIEDESITLQNLVASVMGDAMGIDWKPKEKVSVGKDTAKTATAKSGTTETQATSGTNITINQNNYSPKNIDAYDTYKNTQKAATDAANANR